jgi:hypothetical protein
MRDPPDRFGEFLSGMSWIGKVKKEGRFLSPQRNAGWASA